MSFLTAFLLEMGSRSVQLKEPDSLLAGVLAGSLRGSQTGAHPLGRKLPLSSLFSKEKTVSFLTAFLLEMGSRSVQCKEPRSNYLRGFLLAARPAARRTPSGKKASAFFPFPKEKAVSFLTAFLLETGPDLFSAKNLEAITCGGSCWQPARQPDGRTPSGKKASAFFPFLKREDREFPHGLPSGGWLQICSAQRTRLLTGGGS